MPVIEQVLEKYPQQLKFVFKNFPLRGHKYAMKAAVAALAAGKNGKFWEFHDLLFKNYNKLSDQKINQIALSLGFDIAEFEKSMQDIGLKEKIRQDIREGRKAGVRGTPTVFLNGKRFSYRKLHEFQSAIDSELHRLAKKDR